MCSINFVSLNISTPRLINLCLSSSEDAVDQFIRFIKLGAAQKGIELSEQDADKIELLVLSTMEKFNSKKPKQINIAVNKFNAMNNR